MSSGANSQILNQDTASNQTDPGRPILNASPFPPLSPRESNKDPVVKQNTVQEAGSFLGALKDQFKTTRTLAGSPKIENKEGGTDIVMDEQEEGQVEELSRIPRGIRESQLWEGRFVEGPRIQTPPREKSSSDAPRVSYLGEDSLYSASLDLPKSTPGIWAFVPGRSPASIISCNFSVSREMADATKRWSEGLEVLGSAKPEFIRVNFCCYLKGTFSGLTAAEDVLEKIKATEPTWPVAWFYMERHNHVWSPFDLTCQEGPIDISAFINEGNNELRITHVTDTSDFIFVVWAVCPSEKQVSHARKKRRFREIVRTRAFLQWKPSV